MLEQRCVENRALEAVDPDLVTLIKEMRAFEESMKLQREEVNRLYPYYVLEFNPIHRVHLLQSNRGAILSHAQLTRFFLDFSQAGVVPPASIFAIAPPGCLDDFTIPDDRPNQQLINAARLRLSSWGPNEDQTLKNEQIKVACTKFLDLEPQSAIPFLEAFMPFASPLFYNALITYKKGVFLYPFFIGCKTEKEIAIKGHAYMESLKLEIKENIEKHRKKL